MQSEIRSSIIRTLWVTGWLEWAEENDKDTLRFISGPQTNLMEESPATPKCVEEVADRFIARLLARNKADSLELLYVEFQGGLVLAGLPNGLKPMTPHLFGHYLVMEAEGQGVGLWEWYKHDLKIPSIEVSVFRENDAWLLEVSGLGSLGF